MELKILISNAKYFTMTKVKRYIVLINVFSLIVNFPHFLEMEYGTVIFKCWACSPIYQYGYLTGFKLLFRWILPSLCLIFTNLSVYRKVNFVILNEEKWVHLRGYFHIGPILERIIEEQDIYLLRLTTF